MQIAILNYHRTRHLGGSEIQCDQIATELARLGHRVTYIALGGIGEGGQDYRVYEVEDVTRTTLIDAILEVDPDVVYWRAGRRFLGPVATAVRAVGIKVVFAVSARHNVEPWFLVTPLREFDSAKDAAKWGILSLWQTTRARASFAAFRCLDGIVTLSQELLERVPSGIGIPEKRVHIYNAMTDVRVGSFDWQRPYFVWVANLTSRKNPQDVVKVAELLSEQAFDIIMIGAMHDEAYSWISDPERTPGNLHYLGAMSPERVNGVLASSLGLIHTCDPEGFGNNFIQAWRLGRPTLSLYFDPDGIIEREGFGCVSGDLKTFARDMSRVAEESSWREAMGARARRFALENFDVRSNTKRLESFLREVVRATSSGREE